MSTAPEMVVERPATSDVKLTPFAQVLVTLTKQDHIELVRQANDWKSEHQRAIARIKQLETNHRLAMEQAALREVALHSELEIAKGKIRDLKKRLFGRKSEQSAATEKAPAGEVKPPRSRGQQRGAPGHGRTIQAHLPTQVDTIELDSPHCPCCGLSYADFPGTEDSDVLEIEVKGYRRKIQRRRYRKTCQCAGVPGIISAPPPARLIPRGKYGISIWVHLLLSKFAYGQPTHRLLQDLSDLGLNLSPGTLTGGLQVLAPLFKPIEEALLIQLRSETLWHADETRWMVFIDQPGKIGHRWYLWVFHSQTVVHYVLDPTRSASVPIAELSQAAGGVIVVDRYSAYKKFARLYVNFILAFCWVHPRRDFLELANAHPLLSDWAMAWVSRIGELYHLNGQRLEVRSDPVQFAAYDQSLRQAVVQMALIRGEELKDPALEKPAVKVLESMEKHWSGLTVFVDRPEVPMDNHTGERDIRPTAVGRKNFYGSGSEWSGDLAATMYSLLMTFKRWEINPRTWLSTYLQACAANDNQAPSDVSAFLPWAMDPQRLAEMRGVLPDQTRPIDSS